MENIFLVINHCDFRSEISTLIFFPNVYCVFYLQFEVKNVYYSFIRYATFREKLNTYLSFIYKTKFPLTFKALHYLGNIHILVSPCHITSYQQTCIKSLPFLMHWLQVYPEKMRLSFDPQNKTLNIQFCEGRWRTWGKIDSFNKQQCM